MINFALELLLSYAILFLRSFVFLKIYSLLVIPLNIPNAEKVLQLNFIQVAALFMVLSYIKGYQYDPTKEDLSGEDRAKSIVLGLCFPLITWLMAFIYNKIFF